MFSLFGCFVDFTVLVLPLVAGVVKLADGWMIMPLVEC